MIVLICRNRNALYRAVTSFNEKVGNGKDLTSNNDLFKINQGNGVYEIPVKSHIAKKFVYFVLGDLTRIRHFEVTTQPCSARGFTSSKDALDAIDKFNELNPDYYIDPSCEIETVRCEGVTIYIPYVEIELERKFWDFCLSNPELKEKIKEGKEQSDG